MTQADRARQLPELSDLPGGASVCAIDTTTSRLEFLPANLDVHVGKLQLPVAPPNPITSRSAFSISGPVVAMP